MKALELLKECKELLLDVTIEKNGETAKTGILWLEKFDEAIAQLEEAMKPKTCDGCVYDDGIFCLVACVRRFTHDAYKPKNNT